MKRHFIYILSFFIYPFVASSQAIHTPLIFAHNDYVQPSPFIGAYQHQVDFMEADVFLQDNNLLVAHTRIEVDKTKTLETMYLAPLAKLIEKNNGFVYADQQKSLTLMIDLKTDGESTLNVLVEKVNKFPELLSCKTFQIAVSGNMPSPEKWNSYPTFIQFDGRPDIVYTTEQTARIRLVSQSFKNYSKWHGKGELPARDKAKLVTVIKASHALGKPIRFWAIPDTETGWAKLISLGVDVLNTDKVAELTTYLSQQK